MRIFGLIVTVFLVASCLTEIKPVLKSAELDLPGKIASQQKWLDQDIASKAILREDAEPLQAKLYEIKEKYNRLQSAGALTAKDSAEISRMLDQNSDAIFRLRQRRIKVFTY